MTASGTAFLGPFAAPAAADDAPPPAGTVVVAGATGQTGRRILERLASSSPSASVVAGVRDVNRAKKSLSESSTVVRGAMIQKVDSVSTSGGLELRHLDVSIDTVDEMAKTLSGATYLVIAVGFVPGNPLRMNAAAHEVDNVGTCKLIVSGVFLSFSRPFPSSCRPFGRLGRHVSVGFGGTPCGGGGVIFVLVRFESAAVGADLVFASVFIWISFFVPTSWMSMVPSPLPPPPLTLPPDQRRRPPPPPLTFLSLNPGNPLWSKSKIGCRQGRGGQEGGHDILHPLQREGLGTGEFARLRGHERLRERPRREDRRREPPPRLRHGLDHRAAGRAEGQAAHGGAPRERRGHAQRRGDIEGPRRGRCRRVPHGRGGEGQGVGDHRGCGERAEGVQRAEHVKTAGTRGGGTLRRIGSSSEGPSRRIRAFARAPMYR